MVYWVQRNWPLLSSLETNRPGMLLHCLDTFSPPQEIPGLFQPPVM